MKITRKIAAAISALTIGAVALTGCAGEDERSLTLDFATYNPLSLVIKEKGWLEAELPDVKVNWVQSAGSNKANEGLRSGTLDIGSTAGSAALLARSNNSPIKVISLYSQPEWTKLVVGPDSDIKSVADLRGKTIAATKGTDPYFFLLQALEEAGVGIDEVEINNLQHADGASALKNGSVDAWAGLDPITAGVEKEWNATLLYRNIDFNTWGFLNAREAFLADQPDLAQAVVDVYEHARAWAKDNPQELAEILAEYAGLDVDVATVVLDRTALEIDHVPGSVQRAVLEIVGPIFVDSNDVPDQATIDKALDALIEPSFATKANPARYQD